MKEITEFLENDGYKLVAYTVNEKYNFKEYYYQKFNRNEILDKVNKILKDGQEVEIEVERLTIRTKK